MTAISFSRLRISITIFCVFVLNAALIAQSSIYVGGHIRRERGITINALKNSGFTNVILFNINVEPNGDLKTDGETICSNGVYVFGNTSPDYVSDIAALKSGVTNIKRIESCVGGWGNTSYTNIMNLINANGTGTGTILYRNFKALKTALPMMDAINDDDEGTYDVSTTTSFHVMLADIGFKTTLAPYTYKSFWQSVATNINNQRAGAVDRIYIQCYDGGAGNNPSDWHINGIPLHAGMLYDNDQATVSSTMTNWKNSAGVVGGFFWVYNAEDIDLFAFANTTNNVFGGGVVNNLKPHAIFAQDCDYGGATVNFENGSYTMGQMRFWGCPDNWVSSIKVANGFKVEIFKDDNFSGGNIALTSNTSCLVAAGFNDLTSSFKIQPNGIPNLGGTYFLKNRVSGLCMEIWSSSVNNGGNVIQWPYSGSTNQKWQFTDLGDGVYSVINMNSGKGLDVESVSVDNGANIQQWDYLGGDNQKFIVQASSNGYFKLISYHSSKVVEVVGSSVEAGGNVQQWSDVGQQCAEWELIPINTRMKPRAIVYQDCNFLGTFVNFTTGDYNKAIMGSWGVADNDISSIKVAPGFKATIYTDDNFTGTSLSVTSSNNCLVTSNLNDAITSFKVSPNGNTTFDGKKVFFKNRNSAKFLEIANSALTDGGNAVQANLSSNKNQLWELTHLGDGVYKIINSNSNKSLDIVNSSENEGANLQQWSYASLECQQFIIQSTTANYFHIIPLHSSQYIQVAAAEVANNGGNVVQGTDGAAKESEWEMIDYSLVTSVESENNSNLTQIYLNPGNGEMTIMAPEKAIIQVTNVQGQILVNLASIGENKINTTSWGSGVYIISIQIGAIRINRKLAIM